MKKMLLTLGAALAIAATPIAIVSAQGFGYHGNQAQGDQVQLRTQDQTRLTTQDQARDRDQLRLHDCTDDGHTNYGDTYRYRASG